MASVLAAPHAAAQPVTPAADAAPGTSSAQAAADQPIADVDVVHSRVDQLGTANTASQGTVTQEELDIRPVYRTGQLLESVPGLVVTIHSGEGKANQYLIRGFNLDHGTDFATFVDDVPYNEPTHAHGQGYTLLNSFLPEFANGLDYTKGPFYANVGDFGGLGSAHIRLADEIENQLAVTAGTLGDERVFAGGTHHLDNGDRLLGGFAISHLDGPWDHSDNYRGQNAVARYVHGDTSDGFDVTALFFRSQSNNTTDQPVSALQSGLIDRYGTLDPSDGAFNQRYSLAGQYHVSGDDWKLTVGAYGVSSRLTLWNDFTHYLVDPINGDQEQQDETRTTTGGQAVYTRTDTILDFPTETVVGLQGRHDDEYIDRRHDKDRVVLPVCSDSPGGGGLYVCNADKVSLGNIAGYVQNTTHWLPWFRTTFGLREDYQGGQDESEVSGFQGGIQKTLFQPKGSLIFGPYLETELYVSAGRGYHTNDLRGVLGTVPTVGVTIANQSSPFFTKINSEEIGLRSNIIPKTELTVAVFRLDFGSFLTYDADNGVDNAGPPARLQGLEVSAQYKPFDWIELSGDVNVTHSRSFTGDIAAYGLPGPYISNSPDYIMSFGALVDNLGPWYGGAQLRILGGYPLTEDASYRSDGYKELNVDVGYKVNDHLKLQVSVYNVFNSNAYSSQYAYEYRVSPAAPAQFGATFHPLEPISARFGLTATF